MAELDQRQASIYDLRFFAGLTGLEVADAMGISKRTVELEWKMAKNWLAKELSVAGIESAIVRLELDANDAGTVSAHQVGIL